MTRTDVPREGESMYSDPRARPDYKIDPATRCWVWQKATFKGYPQSGALKPYHVYYELAYGPIPDGYHIHHRCENRACVNPARPCDARCAPRFGLDRRAVARARRSCRAPP